MKVFGSGGLPREPQETQEGSQEEPKELQNPQQKDPKLSPKINICLTNFGQFFGIKHAQKMTPQKTKLTKQIKKWNPSWTSMLATCCSLDVQFWNPFWTSIFAQNP